MSKKKKRPVGGSRQSLRQFQLIYREAKRLAEDREWFQAIQILSDLQQSNPGSVDVLLLLIDVCLKSQDLEGYQNACERLLEIRPNDPDVTFLLAGAYVENSRLMLALRTLQRFLQHWPDHDHAGEARRMVMDLETHIPAMLSEMGLTGPDGRELAALHEEADARLMQGDASRARQLEEQLLARRPGYVPALNNLSLIHWSEGEIEAALEGTRQVLATDPGNFHALSNLARYLCLTGRAQEAREVADRLVAVQTDRLDSWIKKAEALSYLGDDQRVLDLLEDARRTDQLDSLVEEPRLYHLAAVAAMRLGREKEAHRHWRRALKLAPGLLQAQENLHDLRRPVGERHAPWPFGFPQWMGKSTVFELLQTMERAARKGNIQQQRIVRGFLARHPEVATLIPLLLDRGDPEGREVALRLAEIAATPEMLAALRDYALGQRGPDGLRHRAARKASAAGLLPAGMVRLWMQGEWHDIVLLDFEVHDEPLSKLAPAVERQLTDAIVAINQGQPARAERLLVQLLEKQPDEPVLLNNLAVAYGYQGKEEQGEEILRQLLERHPDYLFARTTLARLSIDRGELDQADALLTPLLSRKRFHYHEFDAICGTQIAFLLARGEPMGARSWLAIWQEIDPDNPNLAYWEDRCDQVP